jgi:hypothetical protein
MKRRNCPGGAELSCVASVCKQNLDRAFSSLIDSFGQENSLAILAVSEPGNV